MDRSASESTLYGRPDPPAAAPRAAEPPIDTDDPQVVPAALAALVSAARYAVRAVGVNGVYPAGLAVATVEDLTAALHRLTTAFAGYVGDYSRAGGEAMEQAEQLLAQARTLFSDARHQLALDHPLDESEPTSADATG